MKRKTVFKQMYLVDDTLYNKISNVTSQLPTSMLVGKLPSHLPSQAPNFHPIPNDSNIKREVLEYATGKTMKSSGTMTDGPTTNTPTQPKLMESSGMMTEDIPPTTMEVLSQQHQINALHEQLHNSQLQVRTLEASLRTPQVVDHTTQHHALPDYTPRPKNRAVRHVNRTPRMDDRTLRMDDRTPRMDDRTLQLDYRTPRTEDRTLRMDDRTPRMEDRTLQLDYRTPQLKFRTPQPEALQMQYPNMIQNESHQENAQQLAIPQASGPLTSYSRPMDTTPAPEQLELMDFITNKPIEYQSQVPTSALLSQPMDSSETVLALPPPAATATRALALPVEDECENCSEDYTVTKYVKYNEPGIVALPSVQGVPNNVLFTCTLCNTNFKTQKTLQRHMKNQHDAFDQQEKGAKRKRIVSNTNNIDTKKSKTDKNLRNKGVVSYTRYL
jgi:uncharacterized C2H2 Zn-finger protein